MALDFFAALKGAFGVPMSLMGGCMRDAGLFMVDSDGPADAITKRLSAHLWEFSSLNPDRLLVIEVGRDSVASEAVLHTAARMR
jgi:hypothetical protein